MSTYDTSSPSVERVGLEETPVAASSNAKSGCSSDMILGKFLDSVLKEQRSSRRWGIFFKLLTFLYFGFFIWLFSDMNRHSLALTSSSDASPHTAVIDFQGPVESSGGLSAERMIEELNEAFSQSGTRGVVLRINSPGGSPVQSGIIYDEIRRLRAKYPQIKLYAVVEDICASGGYYVASAADAIYVNRASLVGSIGVRLDSFGFTEAMRKLGVERRLLTAGEHKGFLDSFSPFDKQSREYAQALLDDIHHQFIAAVKAGRGDRLKDDPSIFTGLVWTGSQSVKMGLADGFATVESVARDIIKAPEIVNISGKETAIERFSRKFGIAFADGVLGASTESAKPVFIR